MFDNFNYENFLYEVKDLYKITWKLRSNEVCKLYYDIFGSYHFDSDFCRYELIKRKIDILNKSLGGIYNED